MLIVFSGPLESVEPVSEKSGLRFAQGSGVLCSADTDLINTFSRVTHDLLLSNKYFQASNRLHTLVLMFGCPGETFFRLAGSLLALALLLGEALPAEPGNPLPPCRLVPAVFVSGETLTVARND